MYKNILNKYKNMTETNKYGWYIKQFVDLIFVILIAFTIRTVGFGLYQVPSGSMETTLLIGERVFSDKLSYFLRNPKRGEVISFNEPIYKYSKNPIVKWWQMHVYGPQNWTKRIIGLPGETVIGKIENGHPIIYIKNKDGEIKLDESGYVNKYPLLLQREDMLKFENQHSLSFKPDLPFDSHKQFYSISKDSVMLDLQAKPIILNPGVPVDAYRNPEYISDVFEVTLKDDEYWVMGDNRLGSSDSRAWGPLKSELIHGRLIFRIWSSDSKSSWWILDFLKNPLDFWKRLRWSRCLQIIK